MRDLPMLIPKLNLPPDPVVIDCGCNTGQWLSTVLPFLKGHPLVIALEMLADEAEECQRTHPSISVFNFALGSTFGTTKYYRHECSQSSSLLTMTGIHDRVWGSPTHIPVNEGTVPMIPLDVFYRHHVNLLKLDLQGSELEALRGGQELLKLTDNVLCEIAWVELYKGQPLFGDIDKFLIEQGFTLRELYDIRYDSDGMTPAAGDGWWERTA